MELDLRDFAVVLSSFKKSETANFFLSASVSVKFGLCIYLISVILGGLKNRLLILSYLRCSSTKQNIINRLIWIEQLIGLLIPVNVTLWIIALVSPKPLAAVLGPNFCILFSLLGNFRVCGSVVWSCLIAIYRTLCIRAQNFMKRVGEKRVFATLTIIGVALNVTFPFFLSFSNKGPENRLCFNTTISDNDIIFTYQVI